MRLRPWRVQRQLSVGSTATVERCLNSTHDRVDYDDDCAAYRAHIGADHLDIGHRVYVCDHGRADHGAVGVRVGGALGA